LKRNFISSKYNLYRPNCFWWCYSNRCCLRQNNCLPQRHLVDSRSDGGSSGCWNGNKNNYKCCILRNFYAQQQLLL